MFGSIILKSIYYTAAMDWSNSSCKTDLAESAFLLFLGPEPIPIHDSGIQSELPMMKPF